MQAAHKTIWTIGHSTRTIEDFIALLRSFSVTQLVDVRHFPGSRKFPHFNKEALGQSLSDAGIRYEHIESLGGRRKPNADSENTAWRHPAFRGYADYMQTAAFKEGILRLEQLAAKANTAYMCSEAVWWRCHRSLISDLLKLTGWNVQHIMAIAKAKEHPFTAPAKVSNGHLSYREA
ncbi:MAG: DUF488 domain-containing protein [Chitinophagaceae bacterium]|nr:MAG: DUF488 domain-containing protein [Chitinophagaceae bacterium]